MLYTIFKKEQNILNHNKFKYFIHQLCITRCITKCSKPGTNLLSLYKIFSLYFSVLNKSFRPRINFFFYPTSSTTLDTLIDLLSLLLSTTMGEFVFNEPCLWHFKTQSRLPPLLQLFKHKYMVYLKKNTSSDSRCPLLSFGCMPSSLFSQTNSLLGILSVTY